MLRRFRQHDLRLVTDLTGVWDFVFLGDTDPETVRPEALPFNDRMVVPGCFDATPKYAGKRGLAAYRTHARVADATPHRLVLDGVHHWCRVFAAGRKVCDHVGGFTRFHADLAGLPPGEIEIVILVDNHFDYARCPLHLDYFDWYHYGGITHSVQWQRLGTRWIEDLRVVTEDWQARRIGVTLDYANTGAPGAAELAITCDGRTLHSERVNLNAKAGTLRYSFELPGAALWSAEDPQLHMLHVRLGEDDWRERIGLRQVAVVGREIRLNGRPLRLLGVNRHETHPEFGHGLPEGILLEDVQILKRLGCNFVRGSHYPQDERFLDLCDEAGLLVWSESIGWQHSAEHLTDRRFLDAQRTDITEMVRAGHNHPSVFCWAILNESRSDVAEARPGYQELLALLRQLDPSRPVTYATCRPYEDLCLDLCDFVAINIYPGWYSSSIEGIPAEFDKVLAHLDAKGQSQKPILVSEIGAEAVWGHRDWFEDRWSETYQARMLDVVIRHLFVDRDRVCGLAIWQYCDVRSTEAVRRMTSRGRGYNNKGIVDEYRRPKLGADVVRRHYLALAK